MTSSARPAASTVRSRAPAHACAPAVRRSARAAGVLLAALAPLAAAAQVSALPGGASLTDGRYDFSTLARGAYVSFSDRVGGAGFTASQLGTAADARLVRTSPEFYGPGFCWCDHLLFASGIPGVRLDFDRPLQAIGLGAIGNITGGYTITLSLYAGSTLLGSTAAGGAAGWQGNTGVTFVGAQSATPFDRVEIGGPASGFAMNHFALGGVSPVPEPVPAALLALGLAGLALRRRVRAAG